MGTGGQEARAATIVWGDSASDFATAANWSGGVAPANSLTADIAQFGGASPLNPDLAAARSIAGLLFQSGAGSYTVASANSSILSLGASGIVNADNSLQTVSLPLQLGTAAPFTVGSTGGLTISGAVDTNGFALTLNGTGAGTGTVSGVVSGSGSLIKDGSNEWILSAANSLSGATTVNRGTLTLSGANGALTSTSGITLNPGGTLTIANTSAANNTDRIGDSIAFTAAGGKLNFTHDGAAATNYSESLGALTLNGGDLTINLSQAASGQTSALTLASITRNAGGTILFNGTGLGASTRNELLLTTAPTLTSSVLPWGVITTDGGATYDLATHSGNGTSIAAFTGYDTGAETNWTAVTVNARPGSSQTLTGNRSLNSLVLDSSIDLGGPAADRTLTFTGGAGTLLQTGGASVINNSGTNEYILAFGTTEAVFQIYGTLTINRGNTNNITGSGGLTKSGTGTLVINAASANTGVTRLNEGTLRAVTNTSALGTGAATLELNKGTLELAGAAGLAFSRNTTVNGDIAIISDRTVGGSAGVTHTLGTLTIGAANLTVSAGSNVSSGTAGITFGTTTLNGGTVFDVGPGALLTLGAVAGTSGSGFTKTGAGTLTLSANGSYTGATAINGGVLSIGADLRLGTAPGSATPDYLTFDGGTLSVTATTSLNSNRGITLNSGGGTISPTTGTTTYGGIIAGTGALTKTGAGTLTLSGANTFTGATNIDAGILSINSDARLGTAPGSPTANHLNFDGGTLSTTVTMTIDSNRGITLGAGGGTLSPSTGTTTYGGVIAGSGNLIKAGAGTLTLSGANTFTGKTSIQAGTITVDSLNSVTGGSASSSLGAPTTLANGTIDIGLTTTAAVLTYTGAGETTDRVINLAGTTGGATLTASGTGALVFSSAFTATGSGAKTLTLSGTSTANNEIQGAIVNSAANTALTKSGAGTWILSGANTYDGLTSVTAGTLTINGDHSGAAGGITLSGGTLNLGHNNATGSGPLTLAGGTLAATDAARTVGNAVALTGTGTLGGAEDLTFTGGLTATGSRTLAVNNAGVTTFSTGAITLAELDQARTLTLNVPNTSGGLLISSVIQDGAGTGADSVTKSGTGTLTLSGTNTHSGNTSLTAGTLIASNNAAFGSSTLVLSGGTLEAGGGSRTFGNAVSLTASTILGGTNDMTFTGGLTQSTGNRTLTVNNTGVTTFSTAPITLAENNQARTLTFSVPNTSGGLVVSSVIQDGTGTGADGVTKSGTGTLTLSGTNTYTGNTSLTVGTLVVGNNSALGTGTLLVSAATTLQGDGTARTFANNTTLSGSATVGGASDLTFGGTLTQANVSTTLTIANSGLTNLGNIDITNNTTNRTLTFNTTGGDVTVTGAIANGGGSTASAVAKAGAGTLILSGTNTYAGATTINDGILRLGANNALGTAVTNVTVNATNPGTTALFDLNGFNNTIGTLTFGGTGATATSTNNVSTGAGTLTLGGTVTFSATNNPLGSTLAGKVDLGSANRTFTIGDSTNAPIDLNVTADIAGTAVGLSKGGAGTLVLSGNSSYTGNTTLTAGILRATTNATALGAGNLSLGGGTLQLVDDTGLSFGRNTTVTATSTLESNRLTAGANVSNSLGTLSIGAFTLNVSAGANVAGTALTTFGTTTLTGNAAFSVGSLAELSLSDVSGATTLTKSGAGTLTFTGANSNTGTVTLSAGTLNVNSGALLSGLTAALVVNGGTLNLDNAAQTVGRLTGSGGVIDLGPGHVLTTTQSLNGTFSGTITGAGSLVLNSANTLILSGTNTYTGTTSINQGTLSINSLANADGTASAAGAPTTALAGTIALGSGANSGTLTYTGSGASTDRIIDLAGTTGGGRLNASGSGALIFTSDLGVSGAGSKTLTLGGSSSAANTFAGIITDNSPLNTTAVVKLNAASTWVLTGANTFTGGLTHQNGILRAMTSASALGAGNLTLDGGFLDLVSDSGLAFGRDTTVISNSTIQSDRLTAGANVTNSLGTLSIGAFTLTANAGANVSGTATTVFGATTLTGDATFDVGALAELSLAATGGAFGLTKAGAGTLTLAGSVANTFSGTTTVNAGTLALAKTGGALAIVGNLGIGDGTGTDLVQLSAASQIAATSAVTFNAAGAPTLNLNGFSQTLGSIASTNATAEIQLGSPGSATALTVGDATSTTFSGVISGGTNAALVKEGSGTLTLNGTSTFTGATSVNAGTLNVQSGAALGAGTAGTTVANNATLALQGGVAVANGPLSLTGLGDGGAGALNNVLGNNSLAGQVTLAAAAAITSNSGTLTLTGGIISANQALTIAGAGGVTLTGDIASGTGTLTKDDAGTLTFAGAVNGTTGTVGATALNAGAIVVGNGTETTTLNTGAFSSIAGTTLTIATNGLVVADYATGSTTFAGALAGTGTFEKAGAGTLVFNNSFNASGLNLRLSGGTLSLLAGVDVIFDRIHITGDTILDFNGSGAASTFLTSAKLQIESGITVTINNWYSVANNAALSTIWKVSSEVNGTTLAGSDLSETSNVPLSQIDFTGASGLHTTWVSGDHNGWFDHEIRPTPEPSTYGAFFLSSALALLGWRRWRQARPAR